MSHLTFEQIASLAYGSLPEYRQLVARMKQMQAEIVHLELALSDAQSGILPSSDDLFFREVLSAHPAPWDGQGSEDDLIKDQRLWHRAKLRVVIAVCESLLTGGMTGSSEGLYAQRDEVLRAIENFTPSNYIVDWRTDPSNREQRFAKAIYQRLVAFDQVEIEANGYQRTDLLEVVCAWMRNDHPALPFSVHLWNHSSKYNIWLAKVGDGQRHFTRRGFSPSEAIHRAMLSFLDFNLEKLILTAPSHDDRWSIYEP